MKVCYNDGGGENMIKQQRWAAIIEQCRRNTSVSVAELVSLL